MEIFGSLMVRLSSENESVSDGEGVKRVPNKGKAKGLEVSMSCDLHQKKRLARLE